MAAHLCPWSYVIDNGMLEVFEGHENKKTAQSSRFPSLPVGREYDGMQVVPRLIKSFSLAEEDLPSRSAFFEELSSEWQMKGQRIWKF